MLNAGQQSNQTMSAELKIPILSENDVPGAKFTCKNVEEHSNVQEDGLSVEVSKRRGKEPTCYRGIYLGLTCRNEQLARKRSKPKPLTSLFFFYFNSINKSFKLF